MNKLMRKIMIGILALTLVMGVIPGNGCAKTEDYTDLNQTEITKAMGLGWNLGNSFESVTNQTPGETNWSNPVVTEDLIKAVKAAGFQSIRIPISYMSKIGSAPSYTVDSKWLDRIQQVVNYCIKYDLYVVINMHGDGYQTIDGGWLYCDAKDQDTIKTKYKAVWKQIATRFKDYNEHLVFESMNEISDMKYQKPVVQYYNNINDYNQIFLDTIRQTGGNNDRRWVLIPGWNTNITYTSEEYGFKLPTDTYLSKKVPSGEKRIMISVHYYDPWDFCGGESGLITQWGENTTDPAKTSGSSGESAMAIQINTLKDNFTSKGYPVVIGEFGAIDKSLDDPTNGTYREWYDYKLCENAIKNGCIPMYWDNGYNKRYGFALFDRSTAKVTQQGIIDAMLRAFNPEKETGNTTN